MASDSDASNTGLLDLPMELVKNVACLVDAATLPSLRLACKTLDAASFDEFARIYIQDLQCWTHNRHRWDRIALIVGSKRLSTKVRKITFTAHAEEHHAWHNLPTKALEDAAQNGTVDMDPHEILQCWVRKQRQFVEDVMPTIGAMIRVLAKITSLPYLCQICVDLQDMLHLQLWPLQSELLQALVTSDVRLNSLRVGPESTYGLVTLMKYYGLEVLQAAGSIQHFDYNIYPPRVNVEIWDPEPALNDEHTLTVTTDILRSAEHLLTFTFVARSEESDEAEPVQPERFASQILLANDFGHLQTLGLYSVQAMARGTLLQVLRSCQRTLECLKFHTVIVTVVDDTWEEAIRIILEMPKLKVFDACRVGQPAVEGNQREVRYVRFVPDEESTDEESTDEESEDEKSEDEDSEDEDSDDEESDDEESAVAKSTEHSRGDFIIELYCHSIAEELGPLLEGGLPRGGVEPFDYWA